MSKLNPFNLILLIAISFGWVTVALADEPNSAFQKSIPSKIKRISGVLINSGEVLGIYVSPGLATLIEAPCPISEATVGNPKDITRELSDKNPNVVKVFLSSSLSMSSNLIIQCPNEVIVLDLYPSRTTHQDYLKIEGTYGGPQLSGMSLSQIRGENSNLASTPPLANLILLKEGGRPDRVGDQMPRGNDQKSRVSSASVSKKEQKEVVR